MTQQKNLKALREFLCLLNNHLRQLKGLFLRHMQSSIKVKSLFSAKNAATLNINKQECDIMGVTVSVVTQSFLSNLPCPSLSAHSMLCKHSLNTRGLKATGETPPPSLLTLFTQDPSSYEAVGWDFLPSAVTPAPSAYKDFYMEISYMSLPLNQEKQTHGDTSALSNPPSMRALSQ